MKIFILPLIALTAIAAFAQFPQQAPVQLEPAQKLNAARAIIENYYVENVDGDSIVTEAIKAMLNTLDPHSAYSTPDETKEFTEPLNGKFSGIGVQFTMQQDTVCCDTKADSICNISRIIKRSLTSKVS